MYEDDRFNPAYNADINDLDEADKKKTLDKLFKLEDPNFVRCKKELVTEFTTKSGNIIKKRKNALGLLPIKLCFLFGCRSKRKFR